jgi:hypothetical protein
MTHGKNIEQKHDLQRIKDREKGNRPEAARLRMRRPSRGEQPGASGAPTALETRSMWKADRPPLSADRKLAGREMTGGSDTPESRWTRRRGGFGWCPPNAAFAFQVEDPLGVADRFREASPPEIRLLLG